MVYARRDSDTPTLCKYLFLWILCCSYGKNCYCFRRERRPDAVQKRKEDTIQAFRREFYQKETGGYSIGAQGTEAFAYKLGAIKEEEKEQVFAYMAKHLIKDCDCHLDTGIFGTPYLFETLVDSGYGDLAYQIITGTTYPGYGYMLANGATALWEYWEKEYGFYQCSCCHNQPMFGSISGWLYEKVAGIVPLSPAYKNILIAPAPIGNCVSHLQRLKLCMGRFLSLGRKLITGFLCI